MDIGIYNVFQTTILRGSKGSQDSTIEKATSRVNCLLLLDCQKVVRDGTIRQIPIVLAQRTLNLIILRDVIVFIQDPTDVNVEA